jgi:hypothetical protein
MTEGIEMFEGTRTIHCDGCGVEITWAALVKRSRRGSAFFYYCCDDCWKGRECSCGERMELDAGRKSSSGIPAAWPP